MALTTDAGLAFKSGNGQSVIGSVGPAFGCLNHDCDPPNRRPWINGEVQIRLSDATALTELDTSDFIGVEPWGQWSGKDDAHLRLGVQTAPGDLSISSRYGPLLGGKRHDAQVSLLVNGCTIDKRRFETGDMQTVEGVIPKRCLHADGEIDVEWRGPKPVRPVDLHINGDTRGLGVAVEGVSIREVR